MCKEKRRRGKKKGVNRGKGLKKERAVAAKECKFFLLVVVTRFKLFTLA